MVRVPHCHCGGRGFEPRQPRSLCLNHHPVPCGRGVVFQPAVSPSMSEPATATVPPAGAARRRCSPPLGARGASSTRPWATAATPRRSCAAGAEVLGIDRDPDAIAVSRARLGESGIRYLQAPYGVRRGAGRGRRVSSPISSCSISASPPANWTRTERGFTFRPGAPLDMRMGAARPPRPRPPESRPTRPTLGRRLPRLRRRAAGPAAGAGRSCGAGSAGLRHERRPGQRDPRGAGPPRGPARFRPALPGRAHRGERRARRARACAAGVSRRAHARAAGWRSSPIIRARIGW